MPSEERAAAEQDEPLAWRNDLALRAIRALFVIFSLSVVLMIVGVRGVAQREAMLVVLLATTAIVAYPALTGRPSGTARGWFVVLPTALAAVAGYAMVGSMGGPAVTLTIALMFAGVLLGARVMVALTVLAAAALSAIGSAMVSGALPPPNAVDVSMLSARTWLRSLGVTLFAITLFGGLIVALIRRMERTLQLARAETRRREQAERERADAELLALEAKQLETVGRLAAGVAHDFNNNLTAIIGSAELLKLELPDHDGAHELAEDILHSAQRAAELTRQLLAYSRKAQMMQAPVDLHATIEHAVSLLRRSIEPNIRIVTDLSAKQPTLLADAALLESAVLNLLVNARDALSGGGTLTVSTTSLDAAPTAAGDEGPRGPCVLLEVLDTGAGIDRQHLERIFEPFFTTKAVGKGTGLGLAAVAGTVRAHGGRIDVESDVGLGTAFRIYLPTVPAQSGHASTPATVVVRGEGELLLVDDDAMVSLTAANLLASLGYRVTRAPDGPTALELVRAAPQRFRVVLLDLRMPGLSGEQTFESLRRVAPALPVLIWSGYRAEQDVAGMLQRGAAGFVQKPYRVADLSHAIATALHHPAPQAPASRIPA